MGENENGGADVTVGNSAMEYLHAIDQMDEEVVRLVTNHKNMSAGIVGKANVLQRRLDANAALMEAIKKHDRVLRYMLGQKIEPVAHPAEAVLVGVFGGAAG